MRAVSPKAPVHIAAGRHHADNRLADLLLDRGPPGHQLEAHGIVDHREATGDQARRPLDEDAGLMLVRQKPGSAKAVMFITIEDETGVANLVIWPTLYERERRTILSASLLGILGRVQREGDVVHIVADRLLDLSDRLARIGEETEPFPPATWPRR